MKLILTGRSAEPLLQVDTSQVSCVDTDILQDPSRLSYLDRVISKIVRLRPGFACFRENIRKKIIGSNLTFLEMRIASHLPGRTSSPSSTKLLRADISNLPKTLDTFLERLIPVSRNDPWIKDVLTWVLSTARPLRPCELAIAVSEFVCGSSENGAAIEKERIRDLARDALLDIAGDLRASFGSLLSLDDGLVKIRHGALRPYLTPIAGQSACLIHQSLGLRCLEYLTLLYDGLSTLSSDVLCRDRVCALRRYAATYWPHHYRLSDTEEALNQSVLSFSRHRVIRIFLPRSMTATTRQMPGLPSNSPQNWVWPGSSAG